MHRLITLGVLGLAACGRPDPVTTTTDQLDRTLFVATHPLEAFARHDRQRRDAADQYRIEFFDRNNAFNDVYFRSKGSYSKAHFAQAARLGIPSSTYFSYDPILGGGVRNDFLWHYEHSFVAEDLWFDVSGEPMVDPIQQGAALDADGQLHEHWDPGRVRMSASNPYFVQYHRDSMTFAAHTVDANGFNFDLLAASPVDFEGDPGDFGEYSVARFADQMREQGAGEVDIAAYWTEHGPASANPNDPIFGDFFDFLWREQAELFRSLQNHAGQLSAVHGRYMPFYGNVTFGSVNLQDCYAGPASLLAGAYTDIVQLEVIYPLYPRDEAHSPVVGEGGVDLGANRQNERLFTSYKMAQAMGEHHKPVWALPVAFFEPGTNEVFGPQGHARGVDEDAPLDEMFRLYLAEAYATDVVPTLDMNGWPGMDMYGTALVNGEPIGAIADTIAFLDGHRALLETPESAARTAIVVSAPTELSGDPAYWNGDSHVAATSWGMARGLEHLGHTYDFVVFGHPDLWDDSAALERLSRYEQILLPPSPSMTDAQRDALSDFVSAGGHLVAVDHPDGHTVSGSQDESGQPTGTDWMATLQTLGSVVPLDFEAAADLKHDPSSSTDPLAAALAFGPIVSFPDLSEDALRHLGVNAMTADGRTVVHLVNYDFGFDASGGAFEERVDLRMQLTQAAHAATAYSVDDGSVTELQVVDGMVTVPSIMSWTFVVLD